MPDITSLPGELVLELLEHSQDPKDLMNFIRAFRTAGKVYDQYTDSLIRNIVFNMPNAYALEAFLNGFRPAFRPDYRRQLAVLEGVADKTCPTAPGIVWSGLRAQFTVGHLKFSRRAASTQLVWNIPDYWDIQQSPSWRGMVLRCLAHQTKELNNLLIWLTHKREAPLTAQHDVASVKEALWRAVRLVRILENVSEPDGANLRPSGMCCDARQLCRRCVTRAEVCTLNAGQLDVLVDVYRELTKAVAMLTRHRFRDLTPGTFITKFCPSLNPKYERIEQLWTILEERMPQKASLRHSRVGIVGETLPEDDYAFAMFCQWRFRGLRAEWVELQTSEAHIDTLQYALAAYLERFRPLLVDPHFSITRSVCLFVSTATISPATARFPWSGETSIWKLRTLLYRGDLMNAGKITKYTWQKYFAQMERERAYSDLFDQLVSHGYDWQALRKTFLSQGNGPLFNSLMAGMGYPLIQ